MKDKWQKDNLEFIVKNSKTQKEVLEKLKIRSAGGNAKTLKKYLMIHKIDTEHFNKNYVGMVNFKLENKKKLYEILIENSTYSRTHLKNRLYDEGLLKRECCLCGQDETWKGVKISLILDHINGIHNDNRFENLRIVCPNCNAGLDTFAGKNLQKKIYYCKCGSEIDKKSSMCISCLGKKRRKVERPPIEVLEKEIEEFGYSKTGRKYNVSDNAIRKWIKNYSNHII